MKMWKQTILALALPLALGSPAEGNQPEMRYAIMDNDWGMAQVAPFLLALDGGMELLALASNTANTWQPQVAKHALASLEVGNLSCIPVYAGATWPMLHTPERFHAWEAIHGDLPWEGAFAPMNRTAEKLGSDPTSGNPNRIVEAAFKAGVPNTTVADSTNAANFMVQMVRKYPGQVSIYSAGALTNVALAARMDADFASLAKELVIMGGYVDVNMLKATGNHEVANINNDINLMIDPEAAKIALTADFPSITIAGNVANQVMSSKEYLDEVYEVKNTYTELFHEYYYTDLPFWDETAAALMVDPSISKNQSTVMVDVDVAYGSPDYGYLHVYDEDRAPPNVRNATYVHQIDGQKLKDMMKHALQHPKSCADLQHSN